MRVTCTVNGRLRTADDVWPGENLLYVLRERLDLPGSKNACEQGECGSCTVLLDGIPVCACLVAAGQVEGRVVRTVEGLTDEAEAGNEGAAGRDGESEDARPLDPVQAAFVEAGAVQCGFCTPGLVMSVHDLLARRPPGRRELPDVEIREALAGNLCRCTGYEKVLDAVRLAAARLATEPLDAEPLDAERPASPAPEVAP